MLNKLLARPLDSYLAKTLTGELWWARYFTPFIASSDSHIVLSNAIVVTGNFIGSIDAVLNGTDNQTLIGGTLSVEDSIVLDIRPTTIRLFAYVGTTIQSIVTVTNPADGELHTIYFSYTGTTASLALDNATPTTATWALDGTQTIQYIGRNGSNGTNYLDTIPANFKFRNVATDVVNMRIDEDLGSTTVVKNDLTVLGSELITNGHFDNGSDWSLQGNSAISQGKALIASGDIGRGSIFQFVSTFLLNKSYILSYNISSIVGDVSAEVRNSTTGKVLSERILTNGYKEHIFKWDDETCTRVFFQCNSAATGSFVLDDVTVREIPAATPYGTAVNITSSDFYTFDETLNGWFGVDTVTNGNFATDSGWTKINGATIAGGLGVLSDDRFSLLQQSNPLVTGDIALVEWDIVDAGADNASSVVFSSSGMFGTQDFNANEVGRKSEIFNVTNGGSGLRVVTAVVGQGSTFDNISVKKFIGVAT